MTGYRLTPAAQAELDEIWNYGAVAWGADQADRYALAIHRACQGAARGRLPGRPVDTVRPGYRKLLVGSHALFFRRVPDGVEVIRILHQRMDVEDRLT